MVLTYSSTRVHVRCSDRKKCHKRFIIPDLPENLARPPKCPACKGGGFYSVEDEYRKRRAKRKKTTQCKCQYYWHPHQPSASFPMCMNWDGEPTEEDVRDYNSRIMEKARG